MAVIQSFVDDYESRQQSLTLESMPPENTLEGSVALAKERDPDQYSKVLDMADRFQVDPSIVEDNLADFEGYSKEQDINVDEIRERYPQTATFLTDPNDASLASDDIEALKEYEDADNILVTSLKNVANVPLQIMAGVQGFGHFLATDTPLKHHPAIRAREAVIKAIGIPEEFLSGDSARGLADDLDIKGQYSIQKVFDDPSVENIGGFIAEQGPAGLVYMAAFAASAPLTAISMIENSARERSVEQGRTEDQATGEDRMFVTPFILGSLLLERLGLEKVGGNFLRSLRGKDPKPVTTPKGKLGAARYVAAETGKGLVTEGVTEGIQGAIEQVGISLDTKAGLTLEKVLHAAAGEALVGSAVGGGVRMGTSYAELVGKRATDHLRNSMTSNVESETLDRMVTLAQSTNVISRDPEAFKRFIQENREVWATAEAVQALADSGVVLPPDVVRQLDGSGSDVSILMRDFITNQEISGALKDDVKVREDGLTRRQLKEDNGNYIKNLIDDAAQNGKAAEELSEIQDRVVESLSTTGRQSRSTAMRSAMIWTAHIATQAKKYGRSPMEFYDEFYRTKIEGPSTPTVTQAEPEISINQDFGDLMFVEENEVAETGEIVQIERQVQQEWDRMAKRRANVVRLMECMNA